MKLESHHCRTCDKTTAHKGHRLIPGRPRCLTCGSPLPVLKEAAEAFMAEARPAPPKPKSDKPETFKELCASIVADARGQSWRRDEEAGQ